MSLTANTMFMKELNEQNITFRYNRLDLKDFIADDVSKKTVATRNYEMSKFQQFVYNLQWKMLLLLEMPLQLE